jgi:ParB/RepB/Spo0J family partition protein
MVKVKGKAEIEKKNVRLEKLNIVYVGIDSITPNEYNPNRQSEHDFDLLKKSMSEDGFTQPIIVHEPTKRIVDGEHRWRASRDLGYEQIPVVFVNMTEEQMRIATLRHNRARGDEDIELTAQVLRDLQELGALDWAQDSLQMSDDEINRMIEDVDVPEALAGDEFNEAWEPTKRPTVTENASIEGQKDKAIEGTVTSAMSSSAIDAQREREKRLAAAKNEEERETARQENKLHRVSLVFNGEEAELIEEVLGKYPAEQLVKLCQHVQECEAWTKSLDEAEQES